MNPDTKPVKLERTDDALRLTLDESNNNQNGNPRGGIVIDLPAWDSSQWDYILIRVRSSEGIQGFHFGFNMNSGEPSTERAPYPYEDGSAWIDVDRDTGEMSGQLEVIDGRWGAALLIDPNPDEPDEEVPEERRRPAPLLLFDLWNDPYAINSLHE